MTFTLGPVEDFEMGQRIVCKAVLRINGQEHYILTKVSRFGPNFTEAYADMIWANNTYSPILGRARPVVIRINDDGSIVVIPDIMSSIYLIKFKIDPSLNHEQAFQQAINHDNISNSNSSNRFP